MKPTKKVSIGLLIFATLNFLVFPISPALAAGFVILDKFSGPPGPVRVSGGGYAADEIISIYLHAVSGAPAETARTDGGGSFGPSTVTIPYSAPLGPLSIIAVGSASGERQSNTYYVNPFTPVISVSGGNTPGSYISVTGEGFAPNEMVVFSMGGQELGSVTAHSGGGFGTGRIVIPNLMPGTYQLRAIGKETQAMAVQYIYIDTFWPSVTPSTYHILPTQVLNFSGTDFAPGETVLVHSAISGSASGGEGQGHTLMATITADRNGSFSGQGNVVIPSHFTGTRTFAFSGQTSGAQTTVEVQIGQYNPLLSPSEHYILPGHALAFSGTSFAANEMVKISAYGGDSQEVVAQVQANSEGAFTNQGSFIIPYEWVNSSRAFRAVGQSGGGESIASITVGQFNSLVSASSYYASPGQAISFTGDGFAADENIGVSEGADPALLASVTANGGGSFTNAGTITIPFSWAGTSRTFHFKGSKSGTSADVVITVAPWNALVEASTYSLLPGERISFTGSGFGQFEDVVVAGNASSTLATAATDRAGGFTNAASFLIPYGWTGEQTLTFKGQKSGAEASVGITIASFYPGLSASEYYVMPGQTITIAGQGFAPNEHVAISAGTQTVHATANALGMFQNAGPIQVPRAGNAFTVSAVGENSRLPVAVEITIGTLYPNVAPDKWYAFVGSMISFSGSGFVANENVVVKRGGTALATIPTDAFGSFANYDISTAFGAPRTELYTFTGEETGGTAEVALTLAGLEPYILLSSYYTQPGSQLSISSHGFGANEDVDIAIGSEMSTATANAAGMVNSVPMTIPFGTGDTAVISITGKTSGARAETMLSLAPFWTDVVPSAWYARPGSVVSFVGNGFAPSEVVNIVRDGSPAGTVTADATGSFTGEAMLGYTGPVSQFTFTGAKSGASSVVPITVADLYPGMELSVYYGKGGEPITVFSSGFAGNETLGIDFGGTALGTTKTDDNGVFSHTTVIPYLTPGDKIVKVTGQGSGATMQVNFTQAEVYASAWLGAYAGPPGASVNFLGSGYLPNEPIEILTDRTGTSVVHTFTADAVGGLNNSGYTIPSDFTEGPLKFTIKGKNSYTTVEVTYYVMAS